MATVLGRGTYGCVVTPAFVAPPGSLGMEPAVVTEEYKDEYVSKIQLKKDTEDEFAKAQAVESALELIGKDPMKYGIFPVEQYHCITGNKDAYKRDFPKCADIFTSDNLCVINFEKYHSGVITFPMNRQRCVDMFNKTFKNLDTIHSLGFVHLDIKLGNMGIYKATDNHISFIDWGLSSNLQDTTERQKFEDGKLVKFTVSNAAVSRTTSLNPEFFSYYEENFFTVYKNATVDKIKKLFYNYSQDNFYERFTKGLKLIDYGCLVGAFARKAAISGLKAQEIFDLAQKYMYHFYKIHNIRQIIDEIDNPPASVPPQMQAVYEEEGQDGEYYADENEEEEESDLKPAQTGDLLERLKAATRAQPR